MTRTRCLSRIIAASAVAAFFCSPVAAKAPVMSRIGVAGGVQGKVMARLPKRKAAGRIIESGKPLYQNESVTTGPNGRLQLILLDETIFTIGPNSAVVLDEFVYDPKTSAGKITLSVTKGVFRFVSGEIARNDPSKMEVKLPAGTIGIRGTIVAGRVDPVTGKSLAVLLGPAAGNSAGVRPGVITVSNAGKTVRITKPGFGCRIEGAGLPPTPPALVPAAEVAAILGDIAPKHRPGDRADGKRDGPRGDRGDRRGDDRGDDRRGPDRDMMSDEEQAVADKMMAGEKLTDQEKEMAQEHIDNDPNMTPEEKAIAQKMMAGESLTPEEQAMAQQFMAGPGGDDYQGEHPGGPNMGPDSYYGGELDPHMAEMMEYKFDQMGGDIGDHLAMFEGPLDCFECVLAGATKEQLDALDLPPGTADWAQIRSQVVSGVGVFPGKTGNFYLVMCGGGPCTNNTGTWGFGPVTVDFGNKTIMGLASLNGIATEASVSDSFTINTNFASLTGSAVFGGRSVSGNAMFGFALINTTAGPATELGAISDYKAGAVGSETIGYGEPLLSIR